MENKKKEISKILRETRDWHNIKDKLPDPGQKVVIRFVNKKFIYNETEDEIYYSEDIKVATCIRDYNDPDNIEKCTWSIEPPYPKYDYSPLSNKDKLLDGTVVTHWAIPDDEELEGWMTRFDLIGSYITLHIETDEDNDEDLYRALMWGASFIARSAPEAFNDPDSKIKKYYEILCDLQNCMDKNIKIENGVPVRLTPLKDPENEDGITDELNEVLGLNEESKDCSKDDEED